MTDRIVYQVVSQPGGVDGMDHNNKGGTIVFVTFNRDAAHGKYGTDCRYRIEPIVVDTVKAKAEAKTKLNLLDRLVLLGDEAKVTR